MQLRQAKILKKQVRQSSSQADEDEDGYGYESSSSDDVYDLVYKYDQVGRPQASAQVSD